MSNRKLAGMIVIEELDRLCPDLLLDVRAYPSHHYNIVCMGQLSYQFPIDVAKLMISKWPKYMIRVKLLKTLTDARNKLDKSIERIKQI